ncbi:winged helix DNA-binding domain-containing protein [Compostimonas suwonensis]|uniref:Winged helix DNA-binding protein n=1 Tax=Compostimonas suwonensis TaxID=1048394 RepID=A0A2M9BZA2_9MICO|nr:winged helix DNA-binding domain-containing protein [Compostimonas suwonensis]PJJ63396.1 winged helix DNA-binding protein [Compostimonas suwonensis]
MPVTLTRSQLLRLRLASQLLTRPAAGSPGRTVADVVRWMSAMQGQDLPGALWSVGVRTPGSREEHVVAAFDRGEIVRSWPLRGTLHVLPPEELRGILSLTGARTIASAARRERELGLDESIVEAARSVAHEVLGGGRALRRDALFAEFESRGIRAGAQVGYHLLWNLSLSGTVVLGPIEGTEQLVVLLEEWVPPAPERDADEVLGSLAHRYVLSHGPVTVADLAWWTKLPLTRARRGLEIARKRGRAGDALAEVRYGDASLWLSAATLEAAAPSVTTLALPGFDELLLGYADRGAQLDEVHAQRVVPGNNGMFRPTIVVGGRVRGTWTKKRSARGLTITPEPFEPLSPRALGGFERAIAGYGRFLGTPIRNAAAAAAP